MSIAFPGLARLPKRPYPAYLPPTVMACHIYGMARKTTLYLGDEETALLKQASEQEGVSQGAIITRALRSYFRARSKKARSVGAGRSGRGDLSEQAENLLEGLAEEK